MEQKKCNPCKKVIANDSGAVTFICPRCSKFEIVRCNNCRENAIKYTCPSCGFEGPN